MVTRIVYESSDDPAGWGEVPTTDPARTSASAVPPTTTTPSVVQVQQSVTAAAAAIAQTNFMPPAPFGPPLDRAGNWRPAWIMWFNLLSRRIGGSIATPVSELGDDAQILAPEGYGVDPESRQMAEALEVSALWPDDSKSWVTGQEYMQLPMTVAMSLVMGGL